MEMIIFNVMVFFYFSINKGNGKVRPRTDHEGTKEEQWYCSSLPLTVQPVASRYTDCAIRATISVLIGINEHMHMYKKLCDRSMHKLCLEYIF
jgi:hypothetical protein